MSSVTNIASEKCEEVEQRHQLVAALIAGADISTMSRLLGHDHRIQEYYSENSTRKSNL